MKNLLQALKKHFAETTVEQREKVWDEIENLNLSGPDALEYIEYVEKNYPIQYSNSEIETLNILQKMTPNFSESFFLCNIVL